ncbi:STAM-binding protein [Marchantia polymorpha subsp. ruderalis]
MAGPLNIAAKTRRVEVDNRLSLRFYYRTAANLLKQASIYREENNVIDLYVMLLRFSSLVSETIPEHRDYRTAPAKEKLDYKRRLIEVLGELETLKPEVLRQINLLNNVTRSASSSTNESAWMDVTSMFPSVPKRSVSTDKDLQRIGSGGRRELVTNLARDSWRPTSATTPVDSRLSSLSLHIPRPKDETLSRHSFLTPTVPRRQTPAISFKAQYPNYIDASPIEMPSLEQNWHTPLQPASEPVLWPDADPRPQSLSYATPVGPDVAPLPNLIRQPSPPPVLAPVQIVDAVDHTCVQPAPENVADPRPGPPQHLDEDLSQGKGVKHLHISSKMMEEFMALSRLNTQKNLETCGVLAGSLKTGVFNVTTLIIPKQEATSDSCQTVNEEEIFEAQDRRGLFQLGWIHTHPSQTCFMSSVDLHTHYSYQIMLQEAIAIVMAPTDTDRKFGIFRLSDPGGVKTIQQCQKRGFHPHEEPSDGSPIYEHCAHVYMNPQLRFDVIDLRNA